AGPAPVRRQRLQLAGEALHVGLHGPRLAVPQPQDEAADEADDHGQAQIGEIGHETWTSSTGWAQADQSEPPSHVSRFQMGTVALSVSMQKRAAAKASGRCGADAATTTDVSPTPSVPVRCRSTTRPSTGQRARASAAMAARRGP